MRSSTTTGRTTTGRTTTQPTDTQPTATRRTTTRFAAVVAAVAATAVVGGCTDDSGWGDPPPPVRLVAETEVSPLRPVDDCEQLADGARPALVAAARSMWPEDAATTTVPGEAFEESARSVAGDAASGGADSGSSGFAAPATSDAATAQDGSTERLSAAPDSPTGTNNQEAGVDESDLVKTDGSRIVSVVNGVLRVTELDDSPAVDGTLDLSIRSATDLFLRGDTALVIGSTFGGHGPIGRGAGFAGDGVAMDGMSSDMVRAPSATVPPATAPPTTTGPTATVPDQPTTTVPDPDGSTTTTTVPEDPAPTTTLAPIPPVTEPAPTQPQPTQPVPIEPSPFQAGTTLTLVSLEDPSTPRVVQTAEVEGSVVSARQVGGTARVVLRSEPIAMYEMMQAADGATARAIAAEVDSDALLPRIAVDGDVTPLGGCSDVLLTAARPSGGSDAGDAATSQAATTWPSAPMPSTVTVLTVGGTLDDVQPVSVQGTAETIYASTDALYVAANSWDQGGSRTDVHRFELPADGPAAYTGSGRVPGWLLNQFSLSDHEGVLRVVTTVDGVDPAASPAPMPDVDGPAIAEVAPVPSTSARLTVLDTEGDTLDEVGHLDGLGVGEEVQSVRFMGDTGYVVTFRRTDPLYALDLGDPRAPRSLGELKIPGFSEYLHPVGEGLLLGIGRDADPTTGIDQGFKASLFDVSDPAAMEEVDQLIVPDAWSEVSADHKAFTWDAERSQAIFPLSQGCSDTGFCPTGDAAMVLRVTDGRLSEIARISHTTSTGQLAPMRTIVVDDDLWTLSYGALGRTDADVPGPLQLVPF